MDLTTTKARFKNVYILGVSGGKRSELSIRRIIDIIIHHEQIEIVRTELKAQLLLGRVHPFEVLATVDPDRAFSPIIILKSDRSEMNVFKLENLVEIFQKKILNVIVALCGEHGIYLEEP